MLMKEDATDIDEEEGRGLGIEYTPSIFDVTLPPLHEFSIRALSHTASTFRNMTPQSLDLCQSHSKFRRQMQIYRIYS